MRIVLLGAPGSGKGTQSKYMIEKYNIPQISTGDLLRAAVKAGSDLGRRAKAAMDAGQLVADEIVLGMIQERLMQPDAKAGFILDGFPRNIPQAQALDAMLSRLGQPLQLALLVDVANEVLLKRLTGRRTCGSCGAIYNIYFSVTKVAGKCDKCGGALAHRSDDNEATVGNRLKVYSEQTAPLISYYKAQGKLRTVRGMGSVEEIFSNIVAIVDGQMRPLAGIPDFPRPAKPARGRSAAPKPVASARPAAPASGTTAAKPAAPIVKPVSVVKKAVPVPVKKSVPRPAPKKPVAKKAVAAKVAKKVAGKVARKVVAKKKSVTKKMPARKSTRKAAGSRKAASKKKRR